MPARLARALRMNACSAASSARDNGAAYLRYKVMWGSLPKRHYIATPVRDERFAMRGPKPATRRMPQLLKPLRGT
jgi:hypothetical protein